MTYAGLLQIELPLDPAPRLVGDPVLFVSACDRVAVNLNQLQLETAPRSGIQI
jgi:hypothetical protein